MATNVILPALGMAQETGKILEWLKAEGDPVRAGEALAVIETDKASLDLEAPADGVLARILAPAGAEVPVGQVIALILAPTESAPPAPAASGSSAVRGPRPIPPSSPAPRETSMPAPSLRRGREGIEGDGPWQSGRIPASPKARRLAAERGIALAGVRGSGPGGAVLVADLPPERVSPALAAPAVAAPPASEMSTTWRIMAERTAAAWTTTPHFFLVRDVNASELLRWRERLLAAGSSDVTLSDLLVKAVAEALAQHPRLRAAWARGSIVQRTEISVGLAVAVEAGLVVPVIHQADVLRVQEIAARRRELVSRAQAGRLRPEDLDGGTFTISNLGMYGVDAFNAILNDGQAALLAVGRIADRVVPLRGQIVIQPMVTLTLSCDHRVVDGARGARFLAALAERIERPRE